LHKLVGLWSFKNKLFALKNLNFSKQNLSESRYPLYQLLFLGHFDKLRINLKPFYTTDQKVVFFAMAYFLEWRNLNKENCISQVSCWLFKNVYLNQPDIRKRADALIYWINRILKQKHFQIEIPKFHPLLCICEWLSGLCNSLNQNKCLISLW